jgi:secreted protein with Ig-like and vWFA domain
MCGAAGTLKVYKWASDTANPEVILETSDHGGVEVGRSMNVSGDMNNGKIFFAYGTTSTNVTVVYYNVTNGVVDSTPVVITIDGVQGGNSSNQSVTYDESDGTFWINNKDNRPTHFNASGTIIDAVSSTTAGKQYGMGISLFTFGGHKYLAYGTTLGSDASSAWGNGAMNLLSLGSTAASAPAQAQADVEKAVATASYTLVGTYPSAGLGDSKTWGGSVGNSSVATDISDDGKTLSLYTMFPAQGVAMYSFEAPVTGVEEVTDDDSSRPVEWYTLQGVRVNGDNLAPGIYITRQGKTVKKVLIK